MTAAAPADSPCELPVVCLRIAKEGTIVSLPGRLVCTDSSSVRRAFAAALLLFVLFVLTAIGRAAEIAAERIPAEPLQDDATLRDVTLLGNGRAWAVGDRGAIWTSSDHGQTWEFVRLAAQLDSYSLRSVCFLTDRVGWIVGGTIPASGGAPQGIVLATHDGGAHWTVQNESTIPYLRHVQFFGLDQGIAAGERTLAHPSGVIVTSDGGTTWTAAPSPQSGRWNAAAYFSPESGVVVGELGRQAAYARGGLSPSGSASQGLRGFHAIAAETTGTAWCVGDGAIVLRSDNQGASWQPPETALPSSLQDFVDFRCVAARDGCVWIAGRPGSVIWHSPDEGRTWTRQLTHDPIPLHAIDFADRQHGVAVGELGRICITSDGGQTWSATHGENRRLACLSLHKDVEQTDLPFLVRWAKEDGYRSAVLVTTRRDLGPDAHAVDAIDVRLAQAVQTAGGSESLLDWRLPMAFPSLEGNRERLLAEWTRLTDRRLSQSLMGSLVAQIRLWRPSAVHLTEANPIDAAGTLLQQATLEAIRQAADASRFPDHFQLAGLAPWTVQKVVLGKPDGVRGTFALQALDVLPALGTTLDLASEPAARQLNPNRGTDVRWQARHYTTQSSGLAPLDSDRTALADLNLAPGSDARRPLKKLGPELDFDALNREAEHRRRLAAITQNMSAASDLGSRLVGQTNEIVQRLSPEQAARQLADLGRQARELGDWATAESFYGELIARYPLQPEAADAMIWLSTFWSSEEMNWQRMRAYRVQQVRTSNQFAPSPEAIQQRIAEAIQKVQDQKTLIGAELQQASLLPPSETETITIQPTAGRFQSAANSTGELAQHNQAMLERWQLLAMDLMKGLQLAHPYRFEDPEIQFVTASLMRRRMQPKQSDEIYSRYLKTTGDNPWHLAALGETHLLRPIAALSPKPVISCRATAKPPLLDGLLSDDCWMQATEIRLTDSASRGGTYVGTREVSQAITAPTTPQPIVLLSYDDQYFYFAASVPIHPELPVIEPQLPGRTHDADLDPFDRISIQIDIDRDYATCYRFDVDQRGWTREACWNNWNFNPQWYCAAVRTRDAWRVECAIPLEEMIPPGRLAGEIWAIGISRIMPGYGSQSWTNSGADHPHPPLFGMVRFD